jgi:hypothetical protein
MPWRPIAESGIGFVPYLPEGVTISGSTITCQALGAAGDQSWSLQLAKAVPVRVNFLAFNSGGFAESGEFMFNGQIVDNQGGADQWQPNPVQSPSPSSVVVYTPGEQSDHPLDSYTVTVEVEAGPCEELGRATRNIVSGYQRDRVFRRSLFANEFL